MGEDARPIFTYFIGNSYTYYNDLPNLYKQLLQGRCSVEVHCKAFPCYRLEQHVADGRPEVSLPWTHVVIQEQSQIPGLHRIRRYDSMIDAVGTIVDRLNSSRGSDVSLTLMQTWGRRDGDSQNPAEFPDYEAMQCRLNRGFAALARTARLKALGDVRIALCGQAFQEAKQDSHALFQELYDRDGSHPSLQGSYLAACMLIWSLHGISPKDLTYVPSGLDAEVAERLRGLAQRISGSGSLYYDCGPQMQDKLLDKLKHLSTSSYPPESLFDMLGGFRLLQPDSGKEEVFVPVHAEWCQIEWKIKVYGWNPPRLLNGFLTTWNIKFCESQLAEHDNVFYGQSSDDLLWLRGMVENLFKDRFPGKKIRLMRVNCSCSEDTDLSKLLPWHVGTEIEAPDSTCLADVFSGAPLEAAGSTTDMDLLIHRATWQKSPNPEDISMWLLTFADASGRELFQLHTDGKLTMSDMKRQCERALKNDKSLTLCYGGKRMESDGDQVKTVEHVIDRSFLQCLDEEEEEGDSPAADEELKVPEAWEARLVNLMKRLPNASRNDVIRALNEQNGHAGMAFKALSEASTKGMKTLSELFTHGDSNLDGLLSVEELTDLFHKLTCPGSVKKRVEVIFGQIDRNQDGRIKYEEFLDWCCPPVDEGS
eukprot:TRINITY_DN108039_c0_g1_i1.p1 TRINITY_DN108039_c0_g1~~TRINITY_DN108039_c0_g1_i1.p1  ORF type:complete len:649 (-),score=93.98 TRINITY_DN108039_c0_g1_i1:153-2099(-)